MKNELLKHKIIIYFSFIFLIANMFPITIIECNRDKNVCKCTQIFRCLIKHKSYLEQIKLDNIQEAVFFKTKDRRTYSFVKKFYFGYSIGIKLKKAERFVYFAEEKGDYIVYNYAANKTEAEKFVNTFNRFINNKNENNFKNIHINPLLLIFSLIIGLIIFL